MPARIRTNTHQHEEVTHQLTSVRKHHINITIPERPKDDEEAIVIVVKGRGQIELSPRNAVQFVAALCESLATVSNGALWTWPPTAITDKPAAGYVGEDDPKPEYLSLRTRCVGED